MLGQDSQHVSPVLSVTISGRNRNVVEATCKDGLLRLLNRENRKVIYSAPFTTRENTEGPVGTKPIRICPGTLGGHEWNGSAYSPKLNTLFVPATDWCHEIHAADKPPEPQEPKTKGTFFVGGEANFGGGVVASAGDLVFTGELNGNFEAFNAKTGKVLYAHLPHRITMAPLTRSRALQPGNVPLAMNAWPLLMIVSSSIP